ncbi:hypothetical protein ACFQXA_18075 [Nocardiopsis composta]
MRTPWTRPPTTSSPRSPPPWSTASPTPLAGAHRGGRRGVRCRGPGRGDRKEYEDLTAEAAGQLEDAGEIAAMTGTPEKFFVFTPESAQGRFFADLGLTQHEFAEGEAKATEGRADTVEVSLEKASAFGEASLLFVNTGGEEIEDYAKMAPNLEKTPAFEEDRAFTLGPAAFRLDYYSVPVVADRLVEVLG